MKNFFFPLWLIIVMISCAEVLPPSGGPKDEQAPKLKSSNPKNNEIFFDSKKIDLKFDEFINFKSSSENIFISPSLEKKPTFKHYGKNISIIFNEKLQPNTTYSIVLDNAIEDYNESNVLESFTYVFSTGNYIDSLQLSGNVLDAFTNAPVEKVYVLLYPENEDSILYKKPQYLAKTDKSGHYTFTNLKAGNYKIAALEDKNLNLIYDQNSERIAFNTTIVNLTDNQKFETLLLFENNKKTKIKESKQIKPNQFQITLNKAFSSVALDINNYDSKDIIEYTINKKEINYWHGAKDSTSIFTLKIDTEFEDTLKATLVNDTSTRFNISINPVSFEDYNHFEINFPFPIINFNETLLSIKNNQEETIPYTYNWDKEKLNLNIETQSVLDSLSIEIIETCFTSFHNKISNKVSEDFSKFPVKYAQLTLKLPTKEENLIIQLLNADKKLIRETIVSRETSLSFNKLEEGTYFIRVFDDANNNGIWDNGLFHVKQQAETTIFYSSEIKIKSNFDIELDLKF